MDFHYIANCVSAFSFLSSAVFMIFFKIPQLPVWSKLRRCKFYLSVIFLIVGLSCSKTIFFHLSGDSQIIQTSTLISASFQSLLFACTGLTFLNPNNVKAHWVTVNLIIIVLNAFQMITVLVFFNEHFWISAFVSCIIYLSLWTSYQFLFYRFYHLCINNTDFLTDENSEDSYRWIKYFFMAVSILGITACLAPFMPVTIYDGWMLTSACFYVFVTISFVNYWNHSASLVLSMYEHLTDNNEVDVISNQIETVGVEELDYSLFEEKLKLWVKDKGFVRNDLVSEDLAQSLGVSIATFRSYFRNVEKTDFRQWRMKLRIDYACQIMKEHPDYSYDTVAEMIGIRDRSNFLKVFKKITGLTPREYQFK